MWFHYGEESADPAWVLRGISPVARPGEPIALVGQTGAGKTTIVNLLLRFYEPQRGRNTATGVDIRQLPLDDAAVMAAAARVGADRVIAPAGAARPGAGRAGRP